MLLFFLGVAYIMAGSVLLLQRSSVETFQRDTDTMALPSLPAPPRALEVPAARWLYRRNVIQEMENQPLEQTGNIMDQKHLISRNLEIRHLRRHWFHGNAEQKRSSKHNLSHKEARHKGNVYKIELPILNVRFFIIIRFFFFSLFPTRDLHWMFYKQRNGARTRRDGSL